MLSVLGVWLGNSYYLQQQLVSKVPETVRNEVDFPIYIPASENLYPDEGSFTFTDGVLIFKAGGEKELIFSEQKRSAKLSLAGIEASRQLVQVQKIQTKLGQGLIGASHGKRILILETSETLISIIAVSENTDPTSVIPYLKQVK